jgi:hypothetical protein
MNERQHGLRVRELRAHAGKLFEPLLPGNFSTREIERTLAARHPRAGEAMVEAQHPHPAAVEDVMQRGVIRRVGTACIHSIAVQFLPAFHAGEMRVERLGGGQVRHRHFRQIQRAMQEAARPRGVHDELRVNLQRPPAAPSLDDRPLRLHVHAPQLGFVEIRHAERLRLLDEERVKIGAVPVRVRAAIVGRRGHEQLSRVRGVVGKFLSRRVMVKREAAFQTAGKLRIRLLPRSPFRERTQAGQIVAVSKLLDQKVGDRRGGFTDGEAGMPALFQQHHRASQPPRDHGEQRAGEPGADHRDVEGALHVAIESSAAPESTL